MTTLRKVKTITLLLALALALGAGQLAAQTNVTAQVMSTGSGWRLIDAVPNGSSTLSNLMWEVNSSSVSSLPVSQVQKDLVNAAFLDDPGSGTANDLVFMSDELLAAMEQPNFPAGYEQYIEPPAAGETPSVAIEGFSFGCSWKTETRNRTWSYSQSLLSQNLPFSGGIQGQLTLDLPLTGQVTVAATYKIRKCAGVPVGFKFVGASASGNAAITGTGDLQASASASALWEREWKLAEPELGEVSFSVGWIPVRLVFTLPIYAGASFEAAIAGQVNAHLDASASGTFTYNCTTDTCSGTSNFSDQFEFTGPYGSATVDLDAKAHARVMLRVGLYSSNFAYVEGGLKAYAKAGIWGYIGNTCGDADGSGSNESVEALVADLSWGYQFAYGLGGWFLPDDLDYTGGNEYYLGWRDLLGAGRSTAMQPMILGPSSVVQGTQAVYTIRMRPCYPYTHTINFTMGPGTWTGTTSLTPPSGTATVQRSFPTPGNQTITATATSDSFGRNIQVPYSRTISVTASIPNAPTGLSAAVLSSTSVSLSWADNSNNETQFEIHRRTLPSGTFALALLANANATTATDNNAAPGTSYEYKVRATNSAGASAFSNTVSVTTTQVPPPAPSGLTATVLSGTSVRLNWIDNSNNETQFEIQRRLYPSGTFGLIATAGINATTVTDTTAQPATTYEYRVRATNGAGASAYSNTATASTPQVAPAAPSGLVASFNTTNRTIVLNWTDNSNNENGFTVQFSYSGSAFSDMGSVGANVTTYSTGSNPPTGSYQFRVRAYNGLTSAWSNTASLIVYPAPTPTTSIAWIQPAENCWGPAGTLTAAGYAANGTGTVQLVWRERSSTGVWGPWTTVAYQATPSGDTTWSNTISSGNPTNKCHWFDAYTVYSGVTSAVFHYTGTTGCP